MHRFGGWIGGLPARSEVIGRLRPSARSRDELRELGLAVEERACESCPTGSELVSVCSICQQDAATSCRCSALALRQYLRLDRELAAAEDIGDHDPDTEPFIWE